MKKLIALIAIVVLTSISAFAVTPTHTAITSDAQNFKITCNYVALHITPVNASLTSSANPMEIAPAMTATFNVVGAKGHGLVYTWLLTKFKLNVSSATDNVDQFDNPMTTPPATGLLDGTGNTTVDYIVPAYPIPYTLNSGDYTANLTVTVNYNDGY